MGSNSINRLAPIIEIEDDVIDLDEAENTPEEVIYEWDAKIRRKLSTFTVADNESVLGDLMKEYLESLQEMARSYEDNETLKTKVLSHISFLYLYYVELQCINTPDNYLNHMEDILTQYCNLALEVIRPLKKKDFIKEIKYMKQIVSVARQIIHVLTVYLLERHDHILHVLIKMNTNRVSDSCMELLNIIYMHFLTKVPAFNLCDESFCRTYIVFQKWKEIRKLEDWEDMDKIMYKMFKRTPESIQNNQTLKQILMPACTTTVDIVINLFRSFRAITGAYFKHVVAKKNVEIDDLNFNNLDFGEDEPDIPVNDEHEEEVQFLKAYYEVERNMSEISYSSSANVTDYIFKEELDDDDDVQIVGITMLPDIAVSNTSSIHERPPSPLLPPPTLLSPPIEKSTDLENLNGVTGICVGSPRTVPETDSDLTLKSPDIVPATVPATSCDSVPATNQPKVSFVSSSQETNSSSPAKITEQVCDSALNKQTIEMKSVEVQADYLYNDYGLTTPPFDVQADEQISRPEETRVYTDLGRNEKESEKSGVVTTRTVEVQVDLPRKDCQYNDFGLTPPNDPHLEDHGARLQEPLYTTIGHKDLTNSEPLEICRPSCEPPEFNDVAQENTVIETESEIDEPVTGNDPETTDHVSEFDELEGQLEISEMTNLEELDSEEIDVTSCPELEKSTPEEAEIPTDPKVPVVDDFPSKTTDQIDTGQKAILNSAPDISVPVTAESEIKDLPSERCNGNTILKRLAASNRTNGQAKENPTKIMYTSQSIRLEEFSRFEIAVHSQWNKMKENQDFDDILSGPVSKVVPVKQSSLLTSQDKLDLFSSESNKPSTSSLSNSPTDVTSPDYEGIDDFRGFYKVMNSHVPPPPDVPVPPGILKKSNTSKRTENRIAFDECTRFNSPKRRKSVKVPGYIRRDEKLNMKPKVVVERLSFVERDVRKALNANTGTLRIDYDKTTPYLNGKDLMYSVTPQKLSWTINLTPSMHNPGKVKYEYSNKCEKNHSSCCKQLAEEFKLNCNVCEEKALNLTIPEPAPPVDPESEFSNSPTLLQGTDELVQHCLEKTADAATEDVKGSSLLCDNSNFYKSVVLSKNSNSVENSQSNNLESDRKVDDNFLKLPTAVPESYDFEKNLKNEVFSKIDWQNSEDSDGETRLPLKKRKLSVANNDSPEEQKKEEISYPATPMISIAEVAALHPSSLSVKNREHLEKKPKKRKNEMQNNALSDPVIKKRAFRTPPKKPLAIKKTVVRKRRNSSSSENTYVSKGVSEFDKLLNSSAYSHTPFRLDLTS